MTRGPDSVSSSPGLTWAPAPAGREGFTHAWAQAVIGTSYVPMDVAEVEEFLGGFTERLVGALHSTGSFSATPAYEVGVALVDAHFTGVETLSRTIALMGNRLLIDVELAAGTDAPQEFRSRLAVLQGALAAGYADALRRRTLDEQEAIRQAVVVAQKDAESALRASEARFRAVFADAAIGIGLADLNGRILDVNQSLADMLGFTVEELLKANPTDFVHPEDNPGVWETYGQLVAGEIDHFRMEKRYFRKDGEVVWTDLTASLIRDEAGTPRYMVALFEDISERHLLQSRLRHQALHDPLTNMPNRALFYERLTALFDNASPGVRVGLCYLDLDGFKVVNDSLGHDVGDQLLVAVADRLDRCVSGAGHLVARMGGDEFVILLEDTKSTDDAVAIADAVLATLDAPVQIGGHELAVGASIGIVERAVAGSSPADVIQAADITLYWAKSDGKGRWALFDSDRNAHEIARYSLAAAMPAALERGEFFVEYQPLVRLSDGELLGVEALVRWQHPKFGLLGPNRFIDLAEETGLIVPLGRWVLEQACRQARRWQDAFPDTSLFVSVNLAVRQSRDPSLVEDVKRILADTGLEPARLQLELTESAIMGTADEALESLRILSAAGIRIAIDDFGTGYSNLAYLRHLPVHVLKIDGTFVEGLRSIDAPDPVDGQIVATVVSLAHILDLTVTAECVETGEQAERLRGIGCDAGQGWLFARAASAGEIDRMLLEAKPLGHPS
jgi:diguanylate cyclase (GGDEF)-like protein/PAS domain S-box-containing protein